MEAVKAYLKMKINFGGYAIDKEAYRDVLRFIMTLEAEEEESFNNSRKLFIQEKKGV
mgnify:CR=1 FL=1